MPYRCANPYCQFDYFSMRAVCRDPLCLEKSQPGCGRYFRFGPEGVVERMADGALPAEGEEGVIWLCCYCAMEYEPVGPNLLRVAPDPADFVWRWQIERAEASVEHEGG